MENEYTKYAIKNMGEVTIKEGFSITIYGKYNSKDILIAHIQLLDFDKNREFIMNLVDKYYVIHKITKKIIMDDVNFKEDVKKYFMCYFNILDEKTF
jgi:hypothetical protein